MRLTIAAVGRLKDGPERELLRRYAERIGPAGRPVAIGPLRLVEVAEGRSTRAAERSAAEARALLAKLADDATVVALEETGEALDSAGLARLLRHFRDAGTGELAFVVGGPDGLGEAVRARAARRLALSAMTLPHGLARIMLAEQLYRGLTMLTGHPYHRP